MTPATSDRILDSAQRLVQQRGYHAFSYADIAALVGIRKASIHYYYPSKADLAEALLARSRLAFEASLDAISASGPSPQEAFRGFASLFLETFAEGDRLCPFCVLATAQDTVPESVRAQVRAFWEGAEHWLAGQLAAAVPAGSAEGVARTCVASLEGAMITARAFAAPARLAEVIACLEQMIFTLPAPPSGRASGRAHIKQGRRAVVGARS